MTRWMGLALAIGLGGCSAANLAQRQCAGLGLSPGDGEYWNCIDREEAVVQQNRANGAAMLTGAAFVTRPQPNIYVIPRY